MPETTLEILIKAREETQAAIRTAQAQLKVLQTEIGYTVAGYDRLRITSSTYVDTLKSQASTLASGIELSQARVRTLNAEARAEADAAVAAETAARRRAEASRIADAELVTRLANQARARGEIHARGAGGRFISFEEEFTGSRVRPGAAMEVMALAEARTQASLNRLRAMHEEESQRNAVRFTSGPSAAQIDLLLGIPSSAEAATARMRLRQEHAMIAAEARRQAEEGARHVTFGGVSASQIDRVLGIPTAEQIQARTNFFKSELQRSFREVASGAHRSSIVQGLGDEEEGGGLFQRLLGRPQELRHMIALPDELARNQRGAAFATLGAMLRDAGLSAATLATSFGGLLAIMGAFKGFEAIQRIGRDMGDLYEKTQNSAAAAGLTVHQYSELQRVFQLTSGNAETLANVFEQITSKSGQALEDPFSRVAGAFATLGINADQLQTALRNPLEMLDLLRQKFQSGEFGNEPFERILGIRGLRDAATYLRNTDEQMGKLRSETEQTGAVFGPFDSKLGELAQSSHRLELAWAGLGKELAGLAASSGIDDFLTRMIEKLSQASFGWSRLFDSMKAHPQITDLSQLTDAMVLSGAGGMGGGVASAVPIPAKPGPTMVPGGALSGKLAGEDPTFASNLEALIQKAADNGLSLGIASGFRSAEHQAELFSQAVAKYGSEAAARKMVAPPGHSMHNLGMAADLSGSPEALAFAHQNAAQFGLTFPMPWERWHIEPQGARAARGMPSPTGDQQFDFTPPALRSRSFQAAAQPTPITPAYDPNAEARASQREIQLIQDRYRVRIANYDADIRAAGENKDKAEQIAREKVKVEEQMAQEEKAVRDKYAARVPPQAAPEVRERFERGQGEAEAKGIAARGEAASIANQMEIRHYRELEEANRQRISQARAAADEIVNDSTKSVADRIAAEEQYKSAVSGIYAETSASARASFQGDKAEFSRVEAERVNAVREAENKIRQLRKETVQENLRESQRNVSALQADRTLAQAQERVQITTAQVGGAGQRTISEMQIAAARSDAAIVQQISQLEIASYQKIAQDANASKDQREQAETKIKEIMARTANEEVADFEKAYQAWQKAHEGITKFLDSVGSAFETGLGNIAKAIISPQVEIIHAGLTTITHTNRGQQIRQAIGNMLTSIIEDGVKSVSKEIFKGLMKDAFGTEDLGGGIAKLLGIGGAAPKAAEFGLSGAGGTAMTASSQTASTALTQLAAAAQSAVAALTQHGAATTTDAAATQTGTASKTVGAAAEQTATTAKITGTAAQQIQTAGLTTNSLAFTTDTTAVTTNAASQTASAASGGIGSFLKGIPLIGGLFGLFEKGGIVPSAQGGMVVGGATGGTLAMLHPREMVLPSHLSQGIQGMINGGGQGNSSISNSANLNFSPSFNGNGGTGMSRSQLSGLMIEHSGLMIGEVRNMIRRGWRP